MKRPRIMAVFSIIGALIVLAVVLLVVFHCGGKSYVPSSMAVYENSSDLVQTVIVPTLDAKMPDGKNVIWCASFQLAWDRFADDVLHAPPEVAGAEEIVSQLNDSKFPETNLSPDCYFATAGYCRDGIVEKIRREMQQRFQRTPKIDPTDPANAIVAYGYLEANIPFTIPFFQNRKPLEFVDGKANQTLIPSFGIRNIDKYKYYRLRDQIKILYVSKDCLPRKSGGFFPAEFVIDPCHDSSPNQIVLACIKPGDTLAATVEKIDKLIAIGSENEYPLEYGPNDVLLIPNMAWDISHHFSELEGTNRKLLNKGFGKYFVGSALQSIRFRLDRSGVELASEAAIFCLPIPTHFVFDRPFVIYIKKRGERRPFFAMYVANAELLSKPSVESSQKTQ